MLRPYIGNVNVRGDLRRAVVNTLGENTNNQEIGAADRPELFQKADGAEAREVLAECGAACDRAGLDWLARICAGLARVFERADERGARGVGGGLCGVPCADGGNVFGDGQRYGLFVLPRWANTSRGRRRIGWLRDVPYRTSRASESCCGEE